MCYLIVKYMLCNHIISSVVDAILTLLRPTQVVPNIEPVFDAKVDDRVASRHLQNRTLTSIYFIFDDLFDLNRNFD